MSSPTQPALFASQSQPKPAPSPTLAVDAAVGVRLRRAVRDQRFVLETSLDESLPREHRARNVWAVVSRLDRSAFMAGIGSRSSNAGAPATDPLILLVLWVYAIADGVGSAREIAELVKRHDAYRWIAGGVGASAHALSDFRSENGERFSALITQLVAICLQQGLIELNRTGQDGTRVRASAAPDSFRRGQTLTELAAEAREHLAAVLLEANDPMLSAVKKAARERGAADRLARIEQAIAELPKVAATKKKNGDDKPPRVSTTDPEARVMKMPDGGFRPAYNVQFCENVEGKIQLITGVSVTNSGSDQGQATPMLEQLAERYDAKPAEHLADGGYVTHAEITAADAEGCKLYAPLPKPRAGQRPPTEPRPEDPPAVADWRARMQTDEAKTIYKKRSQTCELPHADGKKDRALAAVPVRGLNKAFAWAALFALSYDVLRIIGFCRSDR